MAPTPRQTCQHGQYGERGERCRKRATLAVAYRYQWGHRVGMQGDTPVYMARVTFRCPGHAEVTGRFATLGISDYATALNEARAV